MPKLTKNSKKKKKNNKIKKKNSKKLVKGKKYSINSLKAETLTPIEQKYCSCLMKVRSKQIPNPYGICTDAVYKSRDKVRNKVVMCSENYNFEKYTLQMLKDYAKEKNIKGYSKMNKKNLLKILKKYQEKKILSLGKK